MDVFSACTSFCRICFDDFRSSALTAKATTSSGQRRRPSVPRTRRCLRSRCRHSPTDSMTRRSSSPAPSPASFRSPSSGTETETNWATSSSTARVQLWRGLFRMPAALLRDFTRVTQRMELDGPRQLHNWKSEVRWPLCDLERVHKSRGLRFLRGFMSSAFLCFQILRQQSWDLSTYTSYLVMTSSWRVSPTAPSTTTWHGSEKFTIRRNFCLLDLGERFLPMDRRPSGKSIVSH